MILNLQNRDRKWAPRYPKIPVLSWGGRAWACMGVRIESGNLGVHEAGWQPMVRDWLYCDDTDIPGKSKELVGEKHES